MSEDLEIRPGVVIPARDLSFRALRASGPGGQNVNKVSSKVELSFDLNANTSLRPEVKARLRRQNPSRLSSDGALVITCQTTRSQQQNLEEARGILSALVITALTVPKRRKPTKPSRAAKRRRLDDKRKQSDKKRERRLKD
ncbi:MAG TPA: alternative ribosome rescue aminoacyl-tRNA hydrolase ArfB [Polyangiaceae bacterium]|nr:alternative ribosome rescue aminoacyl-tRNA hydrolase ArfB [Polyangiaceae bacterium]